MITPKINVDTPASQFSTSGSDYLYGTAPRCTAGYLYDPVVRLCRELKPKRVFDLGCGNGNLCVALARAGFEVAGCDPSESGIEAASGLLPGSSFYKLGVYDEVTKVAGGPWDIVISTEVIEHLFHPGRLLQFANALLGPGGYLILSTPYHGYLKNVFIALSGRWDFHHVSLRDGGHIKFFSRKTLTELLVKEGYRIVHFEGVGRCRYLWKSMIIVAQRQ